MSNSNDVAASRLEWLHSPASNNVDGYEWGIYRVKWVDGKAAEVWQTNSDFSDLDEAMGSNDVAASSLSPSPDQSTRNTQGPAERLARMWLGQHLADEFSNEQIETLCWEILNKTVGVEAALASQEEANRWITGRPAALSEQAGWIDEFGNVFPMGAWKPANATYHDAHKANWEPVFRGLKTGEGLPNHAATESIPPQVETAGASENDEVERLRSALRTISACDKDRSGKTAAMIARAALRATADTGPEQPPPAEPPSRARKIGGTYQADGTIVATFKTLAGEVRHVFEFDEPMGMLHIFGPAQVEIDTPSTPATDGAQHHD